MDTFLKHIIELYELLNTGASIDDSLEFTFKSFHKYIPYNRIGIALLDGNGNIYLQAVRADYSPVFENGYLCSLTDTTLSSLVSSKSTRIINDYKEYLKQNSDSETTKLLIEEGINSSLACPLITNNVCIGIILFSCKHSNAYNANHI